ncbi:MAG: hypothetical protein ACI9R3_002566 [Verrucomicrobiales bacterium]|jgi:hypothetical protein
MNCHTIIFLWASTSIALASEFIVSTGDELETALSKVEAGDVLKIAPGDYRGGFRATLLAGTAEKPITIMGQSADNRPVITPGQTAFHLSQCQHVVLKDFIVKGATANGLNLDDGGKTGSPSQHLLLENIDILETGPKGNRDGIKLSGINHFVVRNCRIAGWGGSGIDMVGCHHGVIEQCTFEGREGFTQSNAVQMKGGSSDLLVRENTFRHVGQRSINIGGSTGQDYFRPEVSNYEATRIEVAGNQFIGSMAPIAWATANGGWVHHNTILHPDKWVLRILQENTADQFKPSRNGRFENNIVVTSEQVSVPVNVGGGTAPETFTFRNNIWLTPAGRELGLPTDEVGGEWRSIDPHTDLEAMIAEEAKKGRGASAYHRMPHFDCDFESGTWFKEWGLREAPRLAETVTNDDVRKFVPLSGKGLRVKVAKGGHYGVSLDYRLKDRTGTEPDTLYFRYYLRFADDWHPERGGKLPGIGGTYGRAGWGGRPVNGTDGWSARGLFHGQKDGKTPIGYYCYHADMKGKYGAAWVWDQEGRGLIENNRWYCIEQYVQMNTPGKNDGILRAWVDGALAFEKQDIRMRDVDSLKIETVWLNVYYGGTWEAKEDYHLYLDDVVISQDYVGPRRNQ